MPWPSVGRTICRWPTQDGFHPTFKLRKPLILALCGMVFDEVFVGDDDYRWDY